MVKLIKNFFKQENWTDLEGVAKIAIDKKRNKRGSKDFGFECLIQIKIANFLLKQEKNTHSIFIGEKINLSDINIKPDIAISSSSKELTLLEIKTITDNNLSWLNIDIEKIRKLKNCSGYLLSVNLYMSKVALKQRTYKLNQYATNKSLHILTDKKFYTATVDDGKVNFFYTLFKV